MACLMAGPATRAATDVKVVAFVDPAESAIRQRLRDWGCADQKDIPCYPDLKTMVRYAKLDGLMIGTRCNLHTPLAIEAAKYDIPLFLEKPVAITMAQAVALEKAFRKSKCEVVVSFPLRTSPICEHVKREIAAGAVGQPEHVLAVNYVPYGTCYFEGRNNYDIMHGLFLQKATHDLDYLMYLMGAPIVRAAAMGQYGRVFGGDREPGLMCSKCPDQDTCPESPQNRARNGSARGRNRDHGCVFGADWRTAGFKTNEDASSCLVEFANGAQGVYTQVFYTRRDAARRGATVSGYQGTISFDWYSNDVVHVRHHRPFSTSTKAGGGADHFGGDDELMRDFAALMRGDIKRSRTPIETGLASVYACLAAKQSAETGRFVSVRQVDL